MTREKEKFKLKYIVINTELQLFLLLVEWGEILNDGEGAGETWLTGDWIGKVNGESAEPKTKKIISY